MMYLILDEKTCGKRWYSLPVGEIIVVRRKGELREKGKRERKLNSANGRQLLL
jgi:hypothetical protein